MHSAHEFLKTLTIVLGTAAVTTVLFQRLKQPVVLGYLACGMIVGPHVPIPLNADEATIHTLSELGIILLMFSLGLEFSFAKLARVGPRAAFIAVVQCSLMVWLGYLAGLPLGFTPIESLYTGGILAISSTTIIIKAFEELKIQGQFKEVVFGVLIVEDLIAILLLTILTTLSSGGDLSWKDLGVTAGRLIAFIVLLLAAGLLIVPRLIRYTVRLDRPETIIVASIGVCFACALLASTFGYSVALGAFIAGSLVAESGEEKRVEHLILPVRDLFGAIFFVSVGMLIDPRLIAANWLAVLVLTAAVIIGKTLFVSAAAFLTGARVRPSIQTGMSLAQIGEFSFIIAGLGLTLKATRSFLYPVAVAVCAITTLLTPVLIRAAAPFAARVDRALPPRLQTLVTLYTSWIERLGTSGAPPRGDARARRAFLFMLMDAVIVAAVFIGALVLSTRHLAAVSTRTGLTPGTARIAILVGGTVLLAPFLVGAIRSARRFGVLLAMRALPPSAVDKLDLAAAPRRSFIVMIDLAMVILLGAPILAVTQPLLPPYYGLALFAATLVLLGVLFWRSTADLQGHVKAAVQVIAEALAAPARKTSRQTAPGAPEQLHDIAAHLPGLGIPSAIELRADSHASGKSLAELDLRGHTGASVLTLTRAGSEPRAPSPKEPLHTGDVLVLTGSGEAIAAGVELLTRGPGDL